MNRIDAKQSSWRRLHLLERFTCIALAILVVLVFSGGQVFAAWADQQHVFNSDIRYFNVDPDEASIGTCVTIDDTVPGTTALTGSQNEEKIFNYLVSKGYKPYQAAGIMGNMKAESHFEPRLVEYGFLNSRGEKSVQGKPSSLDDNVPPNQDSLGQPGYGLVQWTAPGRKQTLRDRAVAASVKAGDLGLQLDYLTWELDNRYTFTRDQLRGSVDVTQATRIIEDQYERHAGGPVPARVQFAKDILAKYGSGAASDTTSSPTIPSGAPCDSTAEASGAIVGNLSLPVDKKWYDQHPDWFAKPHHDYPAADIPVPSGTSVYSMSAGKVIKAPAGGDCGIGVIIDAGANIQFIYCHGSDGGSVPGARQGDSVKAGQLIMHSDNTGSSTGPHVHVQIKVFGTNHCPQLLFKGIAAGSAPSINTLPTSGCTN